MQLKNAVGPILVVPFATITELRPEQNAKAPWLIVLTLPGIIIEVTPLSWNAEFPIVCSPSAMNTVVRLLQLLKAYSPKLVILAGMLIEVRAVQPWKALSPIVVTVDGIFSTLTKVVP